MALHVTRSQALLLRPPPIQLLNVLPILIVLLIQGKAGYANTVKPANTITNFGCAGCVPNYYAAGCVKWGPMGPHPTDISRNTFKFNTWTKFFSLSKPQVIMAPWNPKKSAYDCLLADPEASCCAHVTNDLSLGVWKEKCRNIDGSEIKGC
ncbi:hypothetical protein PSTT_02056 [Puccinia striiformis]|uniref:Uncharacterized protein n=1 Tax=Puccinia striiformis TaxID=27350 RepID=A0A2S4W153_9BASI|nr:hypothetical protein PSTT_02056 [Puccinia striiformis]